MKIKNLKRYLFILIIGLISFAYGCAAKTEMVIEQNFPSDDVEIKNELVADGFDLVSYFELESAAKGNPQFSLLYQGAKLYFSNEENKKKFIANAEKYLPQYDEFCPVSLSKETLIDGKPTHYVVYKEKLYFFYSKEYAEEFEKDPETYLKKASENWEELREKAKQ